jgi:hypothetical protein
MRRSIVAVLFALLPAVLAAAAPEAKSVVVGPKVRTAIIVGEQPPYKFPYWGGHAIVQRNLQMITRDAADKGGIHVPVVEEKNLRGKDLDALYDFRIWVGDQPKIQEVMGAELKKLDDDGYILRCTGKDLYLCGKYFWGTHWAAYDLFERFAGCRWYMEGGIRFWMPGEDGMIGLGDIIPRMTSWEVPSAFNVVEEPSYKMRWFMTAPAHTFRLRYRDKFHHALVNILPPAQYGQAHPEYYPEIEGKRRVPPAGHEQDFQPCISNPEVVKVVAAAAVDFFTQNPAQNSFSVGMNDTDKYCQCAKCQTIAPASITDKGGRTGYSFFHFYNQVAEIVAKTHPDKRLGCLAYAGIKGVPAGSIKLHPMLVPYLTVDSAQLWDPVINNLFKQNVEKWSKLATRMGIYEYIYGHDFIVPRIYNRDILKNIRERYGVGVDGFYAECGPNWGLDGPKYWLIERMLWNNKQDPEALAAQYYADMFGPAAGEMKACFDFLEETWRTQTLESKRSNYRWMGDIKQLSIFPPAKCEEAMRLIGLAEAKARAHRSDAGQSESVRTADAVLRRIDFFKTSFAFTRMMSYRYAACLELEKTTAAQPMDWVQTLNGFETWLQSGSLRQSYEAVARLKFAINSISGHGASIESFRYAFDNNPGPGKALFALTQGLVEKALAQGPVKDAAEMPARLDAALAALTEGKAELKAPNAMKFVRDTAAESGYLFVRRAAKPPTLDGAISPGEWGAPAYQGRFHEGYVIEDRAPQKTTIYALAHGDRLYLAFDCEGDPKTIGASVEGVNTDATSYPKMAHDDAISISLLNTGRSHVRILVNVNGSLQDDNRKICQARARRTETGWQTELSLPLDAIGAGAAIARYYRVPASGKEPKALFSTLTPVARGIGNFIGSGNHDACMCFVWGPKWVIQAK